MTMQETVDPSLATQRRHRLAQLLREKARDTKTTAATSIAQRGVWYMQQMAPASHAYHLSFCVRITSTFDPACAQSALQHLVDRHAMLRTTFHHTIDELEMQISGAAEAAFDMVDAAGMDDEKLRAWAAAALRQPFDLPSGPLVRMVVYRRGPNDHVLLLVLHHLICDGWSLGILLQEFIECYEAERVNRPHRLPQRGPEFLSFVHHQHDLSTSPAGTASREYWLRQLSGELPQLALPTYAARRADAAHAQEVHHFTLDTGIQLGLNRVAQSCGVTLFGVMLAAYQVFLMRLSGQDDVLVGVPMAGRSQAGYEGVVGHFVNLVTVRGDLSGEPTFRDIARRVWTALQNAIEHQDFPFLELVRILRPASRGEHSPLVQTQFNLLKPGADNPMACLLAPQPEPMLWGSLMISTFEVETMEESYDLSVRIVEAAHELLVKFQYDAHLFTKDAIQHLSNCFCELLRSICADPDRRISQLELLAAPDRARIMGVWNDTQRPLPSPASMHEILQLQVDRSPHAVALAFNGETLTYAELDDRSNKLAHYVVAQGLGRGDLIGVCVERSVELVVALIAALKAGIGYVPIDPRYPQDRINFILQDCGAGLLLTTLAGETALGDPTDVPRFRLDADWHQLDGVSVERLARPGDPADVVYVIYTSGSTGRPKGVQIPNRALVNFVGAMRTELPIGADDILLSVTTFAFDIFGLELFVPLAVGARVELANDDEMADGQRLARRIEASGASVMQATPSTWRLLLDAGFRPSRSFVGLCGGEPLDPELARLLLAADIDLWNMYGPTETTIWSCINHVQAVEGDTVSIGRPIANTLAYVLDDHLQPVAIGVTGKLYLGGTGLALSYLNRSELTEQKFRRWSHGDGEPRIIYDTGDRARFLADGRLECRGREDHQIKLRGYRIELEEIETLLAKHPDVEQAVVALDQPPSEMPRLIAFVRKREGIERLDPNALGTWLRKSLPDYMVPAVFISIASFPRTPNGKIDRGALYKFKSQPLLSRFQDNASKAQPRPDEQFLIDIWQGLLGREGVSRDDNFFEVGGHSLLAAKLFAQLEQAYRRPLPVALLAAAPTVRELARAIDEFPPLKAGPHLFTFREGDGSPPLILMPAAVGTVLHWRELVALFKSSRPFVGVYMSGEPDYDQETSLEDLALQCAKIIAKAYPNRACHLLGYSLGVPLAFEVARTLKTLGCTVGVTAVLDKGPLPFGELKVPWTSVVKHMVLRTLSSLKRREMGHEFRAVAWLVKFVRMRSVGRDGLVQDYMFGEREVPDRTRRLLVWFARLEARYRPKPYDGDVLVLRAAKRPPFGPFEADLGWTGYVTGRLSVANIHGGHSQMLNHPQLLQIIDVLSSRFLEVEQATDSRASRAAQP